MSKGPPQPHPQQVARWLRHAYIFRTVLKNRLGEDRVILSLDPLDSWPVQSVAVAGNSLQPCLHRSDGSALNPLLSLVSPTE